VTIKAICFDADGVVVNPHMQFSKYLKEEYGISPEMTQRFFRGVFNDCLVGKASLEDVLPPFLRDWGWKDSVAEFINTWLITSQVVDNRVIHAIQNLRQNGIICCLATSQERNRAEYMKETMGFQDIFDHLFFSCEIGWQKPHHAYYQHIDKTLGLGKDSILFWDDKRTNVESARKFGWIAEIYTDFNEYEETIKKYVAMEKRG
jgi:putative hydrolase of the HAD superfamily